ncbi:MAG TPA: hypothetical protein PLS81_00205 [Deltaproteobacteria bacterium]|nr:hypothetical protein [Deltaproteobacteria bacterium]HOM27864.1 hypothetical protein [Deltaproteobacteria bacterium]HPP79598.1 hypothetical protein [Deltaproteobacteria bacterium]
MGEGGDSVKSGGAAKRFPLAFAAALVAALCALYLYLDARDDTARSPATPASSAALGGGQMEPLPEAAPGSRVRAPGALDAAKGDVEAGVLEPTEDIEEIKRRVYRLNIEDVDDLPLLDTVVQVKDKDVKPFWKGEWESVDDFKGSVNGFFLMPREDGTFVFFPDEETTKTYTFFETPKVYTYDPVKREFSWEMDYYGKRISHKARFITDDVLATMLISGSKVSLELYRRRPPAKE